MTRLNLLTEIEARARVTDASKGVRFLRQGTEEVSLSYAEMLDLAGWLGRKMPEAGDDGQPPTLVIAANDPLPTLLAFFAALGVGARPLILPGPTALGGLDNFVQRTRQTLERLPGRRVLALEDSLIPDTTPLPDVPVVPLPLEPGEYGSTGHAGGTDERTAGGDDIAFLQMTSASTGDNKVVAISHANACANLHALRHALGAADEERVVCWLPLHHDMGLVGGALFNFFWGHQLDLMKPSDFIMRPHRWITAMSRARCTMTTGPTFGYEYARRLVSDRDIAGVDLSSLRCAIVGAEPIRHAVLRDFSERFRPYGLRGDVFVPSYGMAESTLASVMAPPCRPARYVVVGGGPIASGEPVQVLREGTLGDGPIGTDDEPAAGPGVAVFSVGTAVAGLEFHLLDDEGDVVTGEAVLGEVALRGSSVSVGYLDPSTGRPVGFRDGTLATGDLGFVHRGELFILERKKHVIIRHGRNFLASLLEQRAAEILGVPAQELIVIDTDIHDPASDIAVIVENVSGQPTIDADQHAALRALELPVDVLLFARRRVIPRTTSGKKTYHVCRQRLANRELAVSHVVRLEEKA